MPLGRAHPLLVLLIAGCASAPDAPPEPGLAAPAVATVNRTPITQSDVDRMAGRSRGHGGAATTPDPAATLEAVIDEELLAQHAEALGLADDAFIAELDRRRAEVDDWRRRTLADRLLEHELSQPIEVSDAEVDAWLAENGDTLRTEVHVYQALRRSRADIEAVQAALASGASFEAAAMIGIAIPPDLDSKPWDVGWLHDNQMPPQWREPLAELPAGQPSAIIEGPRQRFWIVQWVDRRVDPDTDEAALRDIGRARLGERGTSALARERATQLRDEATITRTPPTPR